MRVGQLTKEGYGCAKLSGWSKGGSRRKILNCFSGNVDSVVQSLELFVGVRMGGVSIDSKDMRKLRDEGGVLKDPFGDFFGC